MKCNCPKCGLPIDPSVTESSSEIKCTRCGTTRSIPNLAPPSISEPARERQTGGQLEGSSLYPQVEKLRKLGFQMSGLTVSHPTVEEGEAQRIVADRMRSYGKNWVRRFGERKVLDSLRCIYVPFWVASGECSGRWTAQVGFNMEVEGPCRLCSQTGRYLERICYKCGGRGTVFNHTTDWRGQEGLVTYCGLAWRINIPEDSKLLRGPNISPSNEWSSGSHTGEELVIPPLTMDEREGIRMVKDLLIGGLQDEAKKSVRTRGVDYRDLHLGAIECAFPSLRHYLHPVWFGGYRFKGKTFLFQVDGISGDIDFEVPVAAKFEMLLTRGVIAMVVAAFVGITLQFIVRQESGTADGYAPVLSLEGDPVGSPNLAGAKGETVGSGGRHFSRSGNWGPAIDSSLAEEISISNGDTELAFTHLDQLGKRFPGAAIIAEVSTFLTQLNDDSEDWAEGKDRYDEKVGEAKSLWTRANAASQLSPDSISNLPEEMRPERYLAEAFSVLADADESLEVTRKELFRTLEDGGALGAALKEEGMEESAAALASLIGDLQADLTSYGKQRWSPPPLTEPLESVQQPVTATAPKVEIGEIDELTILTSEGAMKTFFKVRILEVEPEGIRILHSTGTTRIHHTDIPPALRRSLGFKPLP